MRLAQSPVDFVFIWKVLVGSVFVLGTVSVNSRVYELKGNVYVVKLTHSGFVYLLRSLK